MSAGALAKLPYTVVHYGRHDPRRRLGGVERFALNLAEVFENVVYMTPSERDPELAVGKGWPVICDNHLVLDWPERYPVIGFQHGVAAVKAELTGSWTDRWLAHRQKRAARRPRTLWVACARWIGETFGERFGNRAAHVIYHPIDVATFDGKLENRDSRLVLHDARTAHKGKHLVLHLARTFPEWTFEPLACAPAEVPDRLRRARAFVHLSRYEGNSLVCGEAMAMNLPCLFSDVGLMREHAVHHFDVHVASAERIHRSLDALEAEARAFLGSLGEREYRPRPWILEHASVERGISAWARALDDYRALRAG